MDTHGGIKRKWADGSEADGANNSAGQPADTGAEAAGAEGKQKGKPGDASAAAEPSFPEPLQNLICYMLDVLIMDDAPRAPTLAKQKARKLKNTTHQTVTPLFIGFEDVRLQLAAGSFTSIHDMYRQLEAHCAACYAALEEANADNPAFDAKLRQYLQDAQQQYAQEVIGMCEEVAEARMGRAARRQDTEVRARRVKTVGDEGMPPLPALGVPLPDSVRTNLEPYFQGPWRKEPYQPRSYESVTQYILRSTSPEEQALLQWKLTTRRPDGASEHFHAEHAAILGPNMRATELRLAEAVKARRTLQMGVDVREVDTWGFDMYTRRNCFDALYEGGAFADLRQGYVAPLKKEELPPDTPAGLQIKAEATGAEGDVKQEAGPMIGSPPASSSSGGINICSPEVKAKLAAGSQARVALGSKVAEAAQDHHPHDTEGPAAVIIKQEPGPTQPGPLGVPVLDPAAIPVPGSVPGPAERLAIQGWIDTKLLPAANATGLQGFNMRCVCDKVRERARACTPVDSRSLACADALEVRLCSTGWNYFRLHPKGRGIECARQGGLPAYTFIEEYFGELYSATRWWEIQEAVRRVAGEDDLPDFYNITLERPKDDPDGFDLLYVEAAFMATFASRMSHSCTPNCSAVVVSAGGKLTIAMYTLRHVEEGEELTFDYNCVTESEKEFRSATCLCGTTHCRGSYLLLLGAKAFSVALEAHHNVLHRHTLLLRACLEPLTPADEVRLASHALGPIALGNGMPGTPVAPPWLRKWAALALEFVELERRVLPHELLALPPPFNTFPSLEYAEAQAQGVMSSRVTSIVVTLDVCKHFLQHPGQLQTPPVRLLTDQEVLAYLWTGDRSLARRVLMSAAPFMRTPPLPLGQPLPTVTVTVHYHRQDGYARGHT